VDGLGITLNNSAQAQSGYAAGEIINNRLGKEFCEGVDGLGISLINSAQAHSGYPAGVIIQDRLG